MGRAGSGLRKGLALAAACAAVSAGAPAAAGAAAEDRAYEMVSPAAKNGNDVRTRDTTVLSTPDADRVAYIATGGFSGAQTSLAASYYVAERGTDWSTTPLDVPQLPSTYLHFKSLYAVSKDLSKTVVASAAALAPGAISGGANLYVHDRAAGKFSLVAASAEPTFAADLFRGGALPVDAVSADLDRIVFTSSAALLPEAPPVGVSSVYEWADGELRLVSRLPDGSPAPDGALAGRADRFARAPRLLSRDGGRIVFTAPTFFGGVYLRDGGETIPVSISRRAGDDPSVARTAHFVAATADGSQVFFVSGEQLTDDSTAVSWAGGGELYRYDVASRNVVDLTVATDPLDWGGGQVVDVPWVAADGSDAFVVAAANLAPGGVSGANNLYHWSAHGPTRLIGQLDPWEWAGIAGSIAVSPGERYVAFRTAGRLTAYDNTPPNPNCKDLFGSDGACPQVYRYDTVTGDIVCSSCDPSGAPPSGPATLGGQGLPSAMGGLFARAVLDDGRVFVDSPESLVAEDTNDVADVYVHDGERPHLISTGEGDEPATFAEVTPSGHDVFFFTRARLVGRDTDDLVDLYDARVGGGIPEQNPSPPSPPCRGAECRGPLPPPAPEPPSPPPATTDETGGGDARENAPSPPSRVRVGRPVASGARVALDVTVSSRGMLEVRGARIVAIRRGVPRAGTYRLRLAPARHAARAIVRRGRLAAAVRVTFTPRAGAPSSARLIARFRRETRR